MLGTQEDKRGKAEVAFVFMYFRIFLFLYFLIFVFSHYVFLWFLFLYFCSFVFFLYLCIVVIVTLILALFFGNINHDEKWWRFIVTACIHTKNISGTLLQNGSKRRWVREGDSFAIFFILKTPPRNTILQSSIFDIFTLQWSSDISNRRTVSHLIFPIEGLCLKTNLWRCASKTRTCWTSSPRAAKQLLTRAAKC